MLELAPLYAQDPSAAHDLVRQIVRNNLTVEALRQRIATQCSTQVTSSDRENKHRCRASTTSVQDITSSVRDSGVEADVLASKPSPVTPSALEGCFSPSNAIAVVDQQRMASEREMVLALLQEAVSRLTLVVAHVDHLPHTLDARRALETAENAIQHIRSTFATAARSIEHS
jgi:hypothetical protein